MACTMTMNTSSDDLVNIYHRKGMLLAGVNDRMDTGEMENDSEAINAAVCLAALSNKRNQFGKIYLQD